MSTYLTYYERMKKHGIENRADSFVIDKMNSTVVIGIDDKMKISANNLVYDYDFDENLVDDSMSEIREFASSNQGRIREKFLRILTALEHGAFRPGKQSVRNEMDRLRNNIPNDSALYELIPLLKSLPQSSRNDSDAILGRKSVVLDSKKAKLVGLSDANRTGDVQGYQANIDTVNKNASTAINDISLWDGTGTAPPAYGV